MNLRILALVLAGLTLRSAGVEAPKISPKLLTPALDAMLTPVGKGELEEARARAPDQDAVLVLHEVIHRVDEKAGAETLFHLVMHARTEAGVGQVREQSHSHSRQLQDLRLVRATVHQPDGTRQQAHDADLIVHTPQYDAEQSVYSDQQELRVVLPGVRPGSVVDVVWLRRQAKPLVPGAFLAEMPFTPDPATPARTRLVVDLPDSLASRLQEGWAAGEGPKRVSLNTDRKRQRFEWARGPSSSPAQPGEEVDLAREWPRLSLTTASGWDDIAAWFNALTLPRGKPGPEVKAAAAALAPARAPATDVLRAALERVSRGVRYTGFEFGVGSHQPHDCNEVWRRQFGDCKDKSNLLRVLLAERGIRSWMVLVESGPTPGSGREGVPTPWAFNHALLAVDDGAGGLVYCDPVHTHLPPGVAPGEWGDRDALLVREDRAEWVRLPAAAPPRIEDEYELTLEPDGALHGWREIRWSGRAAPHKAAELILYSSEDRLNFHRKLAELDWPGSLRADDLPDRFDPTNLIFSTRYHFVRPPTGAADSSSSSLTLPVHSNLSAIMGLNRDRKIAFRAAKSQHHLRVRLRLPPGTLAADLPKPFARDLPEARFWGEVKGAGGRVELSCGVEFRETDIATARFPPVWDALQALVKWGDVAVETRVDSAAPPPETAIPDPPRLPTAQGQYDFVLARWKSNSEDPARNQALRRLVEWFPAGEEAVFNATLELNRTEKDRALAARNIDAMLGDSRSSLSPRRRALALAFLAELYFLDGRMEAAATRATTALESGELSPRHRGILLTCLAIARFKSAPAEALATYAKAAEQAIEFPTPLYSSWAADAAQAGSERDLEAALTRMAALTAKNLEESLVQLAMELRARDEKAHRLLYDTLDRVPGPAGPVESGIWHQHGLQIGLYLVPTGAELEFVDRLRGLIDKLDLPGREGTWSAGGDTGGLLGMVRSRKWPERPARPETLWLLLSAALRRPPDGDTLQLLSMATEQAMYLANDQPPHAPACLRLLDDLARAPPTIFLRGQVEHSRVIVLSYLGKFKEAQQRVEAALADRRVAKWHFGTLQHTRGVMLSYLDRSDELLDWLPLMETYLEHHPTSIPFYLVGASQEILAGKFDAAMSRFKTLAGLKLDGTAARGLLLDRWFEAIRHAAAHPRETREYWQAMKDVETMVARLQHDHQAKASILDVRNAMMPGALSRDAQQLLQASLPASAGETVRLLAPHFPLARLVPEQALDLVMTIHRLSESPKCPDCQLLLIPVADALLRIQPAFPAGQERDPGRALAARVLRAARTLDSAALETEMERWLTLRETADLRPGNLEFTRAVRLHPPARAPLRARLVAALDSGPLPPPTRAAALCVLAHILLHENKPAEALARLSLELRDPRLEGEEPSLADLQAEARIRAASDPATAAAEAEQCAAWFDAHWPKWNVPGLPRRLRLEDGREWPVPQSSESAALVWWNVLAMRDPGKSGDQRWLSTSRIVSTHLALTLPRAERRRWVDAWFLDSHPLPDLVRESAVRAIVGDAYRRWDPELLDLLAAHPSPWFTPDLRGQLRRCATDLQAPPSEADMRDRLVGIAANPASHNSGHELLLLFERSLRLGLFDLAEIWLGEMRRFIAADIRNRMHADPGQLVRQLDQARSHAGWMRVARDWLGSLPGAFPVAPPDWLSEFAITDTACVLLPAEHRREWVGWQLRNTALSPDDASAWMHWLATVELSGRLGAEGSPLRKMIQACGEPRMRLVLLMALRESVDLSDADGREGLRRDLDTLAETCGDGPSRQAIFLLRLRLALRAGEPLSLDPVPASGLPVETTTDPAAQVERFDLLLADAVARNDATRLRQVFTELAAHPMQNRVNPAHLAAALVRFGDTGGIAHFQAIWRNLLAAQALEVAVYKVPEACALLDALLRALNQPDALDPAWLEAFERTPWPAHREAYALRLTLRALGRDWPRVESLARQAIAQHPRHPVFQWNLAESLVEQRRDAEARPLLDAFIQRGAGHIELRRALSLRLLMPPAVPPGAGANGVGE